MLDINDLLNAEARQMSASAPTIRQQIAELTTNHEMSEIYSGVLADFGYGHFEDGDVDLSISDADKELLITTATQYLQDSKNLANEQGQRFDYIKERPALTAVFFQMLDKTLDKAIVRAMASAQYGEGDELPTEVAALEVQRTHLMGIWAQLEDDFLKRGFVIPDEFRFENIGLTRVGGAIRDGVMRERRRIREADTARQREVAAARERAVKTNTTLGKEFAKQLEHDNLDPKDPKYKQKALGMAIRAARLMLSMTQAEVAGSNFSVSYISAVERGQIRPSLGSLDTLAESLNITAEELMAFTDPNFIGRDK